jgi:hypothetical protein
MKLFFSFTPDGAGSLLRRQALDIVLNNIVWVIDREEEIVNSLFDIKDPPSTTTRRPTSNIYIWFILLSFAY